jgi:hypothetical protein
MQLGMYPFIVHPIDLGSNLDFDKIFSDSVGLNSNLKGINSGASLLNTCIYIEK